MKLKNYQSRSPIDNIFKDIEKTLIAHGAKQIVREYENGLVYSISFLVPTHKGDIFIKLPARVKQVQKLFDQQNIRYKPDQPYRAAWATIRDWISAQMALIDWEMVKLEEVFLPYAVDENGQTIFERLQNRNFKLGKGD